MNVHQHVEDLCNMIAGGRLIDAFDKYYHDEVVMQENENPPTLGKQANRDRELDFLNAITEFRRFEVKSVATNGDVAMVESLFDYTHKDWGSRTYTQVAVQKWQNGKIISERFYYGN